MTGGRTHWQFTNPVSLIFGPGSLSRLGELTPWRSVLVVTSAGTSLRGTTDLILDLLRDREVTVCDAVIPQPQLADLEETARRYCAGAYDGIVAVGGGSAIDTGKVLSYLLRSHPEALRQHLEQGTPLDDTNMVPFLAVPTTAGTGAEVTSFASIWDFTRFHKYSFSSPGLYARTALLDPELTLSAPRGVTLSTGLDALCQGLESMWSSHANPVAASYAVRGVAIALRALPRLMEDPSSLELRSQMMEASLLAGLAISSTKTTLPHSISYPLTMHFGVPHGLACASTIAQAVRFNSEAVEGGVGDIASALGFTTAEALASALEQLLARTGALDWLASLIPPRDDLLALARESITLGRTDNNPRSASVDDIRGILDASWAMVAGRQSSGIPSR